MLRAWSNFWPSTELVESAGHGRNARSPRVQVFLGLGFWKTGNQRVLRTWERIST